MLFNIFCSVLTYLSSTDKEINIWMVKRLAPQITAHGLGVYSDSTPLTSPNHCLHHHIIIIKAS